MFRICASLPRTFALALGFMLLAGLRPAAAASHSPYHPAPPARPQQLLVRFRPDVTPQEKEAFLRRIGATGSFDHRLVHWTRVDLSARSSARTLARDFATDAAVASIEPVVWYQALRTPDDTQFPGLDGLQNTGQTGGYPGADISATRAWDVTTGDTSVIVAIIDSGTDWTHPDLAANILHNYAETANNGLDDDHNGFVDDVVGWDFVNNDNDPYDDYIHGTHVAGTVGAVGNNGAGVTGVAWNVRLLPLKFLDYQGQGSTDAAVSAIEYAIQRGARVINASWGSSDPSDALRDAIIEAGAHGIVFVAAAGNAGTNNDDHPFYPAAYNLPNMICVAATDKKDNLAYFSNYGPLTVHIAAPGVNTLSTTPTGRYNTLSGTSMATPHVSGVAALVASRHHDWTAAQIRDRIVATADPLPSLIGKCTSEGRLNAFRAVADDDHTPPAAVRDLHATRTGATSVTLQWTATGDDGMSGRATHYRLALGAPVDTAFLNLSDAIKPAAQPSPPGSQDSLTLSGLKLNTPYQFVLQVRDEWDNASAASNIVSAATQGIPVVGLPITVGTQAGIGEQIHRTMHITNNGTGPLEYTLDAPLPLARVDAVAQPAFNVRQVKGADLPIVTFNPPQTSGGPDGYGYRFVTSDNTWGPKFHWVEISGNPDNTLPLFLDDQYHGAMPMTIRFPFYGSVVDSFGASTNGFVGFATPSSQYLNTPLPSVESPAMIVAPFWDDLNFVGHEHAYAWGDTGRFIVEWKDVPRFDQQGLFSFEVIFYPSGEMDFEYLSMGGNKRSATIGIQDASRTRGLTALFNDFGIHDSLAVRIRREPNWIVVSPLRGTVAPGQSLPVDLTYDARDLAGGLYTGRILVHTNDPVRPDASVPVTLLCQDGPSAVVPPSQDFGPVFTGTESLADIPITNSGASPLAMGTATVSGVGYSLVYQPTQVPPHSTASVRVRFAPAAPGIAVGDLSLHTGDPVHANPHVAMGGSGALAPHLGPLPDTLRITVAAGSGSSLPVELTSTGAGTLHVHLEAWSPLGDSAAVQLPIDASAGTKDNPAFTLGATSAQFVRGPDAFGYRGRSSDEPQGPGFQWEEIASPANLIPDVGDDFVTGFGLAAPVPFYGHMEALMNVCSNGWISPATGNDPSFGTLPLPVHIAPKSLLAVFWQDLVVDQPSLYSRQDERGVLVEWNGVRRYNTNSRYTFEARIEPSGRILYQYLSLEVPDHTAGIGLQNFDATSGFDLSLFENNVHSGTAIEIIPTARWISMAQETGELPPGSTLEASLAVDAGALPPGRYPATVGLDTDSPGQRHLEIPVVVTVVTPVQVSVALFPDTVGLGPGPSRVTARVSVPAGIRAEDFAAAGARLLGDVPSKSAETVAQGNTVSFAFDRSELEARMVGAETPATFSVSAGSRAFVAQTRLFARTPGLLFPRGGESFQPGVVTQLRVAAAPGVSLESQWSLDGGATWLASVHGTTAPGGALGVPPHASPHAILRIYARDALGHRAATQTDREIKLEGQVAGVETNPAGKFDLRVVSALPARAGAVFQFSLPAAAEAKLELFDVSGRRVRVLHAGPAQAGAHRLEWNGRDDTGQPAASGVFFARLESAGKSIARKLAFVRGDNPRQ